MRFKFGLILTMIAMQNNNASNPFDRDTIATQQGDLVMTFIGHASLMFEFNNCILHIDPVAGEGDYTQLPKADIVLITHDHYDHFDREALQKILQPQTKVFLTQKCSWTSKTGSPVIMKNGDVQETDGIRIEAVPAYNIKHMRSPNNPFHPKGEGNGYIVTIGGKRVYIAGDTENTPEMKALKNIDVAFLPMNLPYTMTPEMVADAAKAFKPAILYPYHYGSTDTGILLQLLSNTPEIEIRIRDLQ